VSSIFILTTLTLAQTLQQLSIEIFDQVIMLMLTVMILCKF